MKAVKGYKQMLILNAMKDCKMIMILKSQNTHKVMLLNQEVCKGELVKDQLGWMIM